MRSLWVDILMIGCAMLMAGSIGWRIGRDQAIRDLKITTNIHGEGIEKTILVYDPSGPKTVQIGDVVLTDVHWYRRKENVGKPFDYELGGGR